MKLGTNIHHESGHCWKRFQSQWSKVKVTVRPNASEAVACIFENGRSYKLCVNFCQWNTCFMVSLSCGQKWRLPSLKIRH